MACSAVVIELPNGDEYRLVPDFNGVTLGRILRRPKVIAIPVLVATLISGLVCFLLARYLTTPIQRLSRATHQYASGDLDLRVEPAMKGRKDEIADLASDFDHMAERLQLLIGSQKQLLSDVSHELRSPLARLQVALGLARQREPGNESPELDRIEIEAERLNELIEQLLSLSRLESSSVPTNTESVDVDQLLLDVIENANYEAESRNCKVQLLESIPASIEANEALLRSAIENVVRNAVIYTEENSEIEISMYIDSADPSWLSIKVRDHGPGIPDKMLENIFEPFVRVSEARDRQSGGYGLGLAIVERAIRLHDGEITASNQSDGGLCIHIRLPRMRSK